MKKDIDSRAEVPPETEEPNPPTDNSGVRALIDKFEGSIGNENVKVSVTEYIRLVQLEREMKDAEPADVQVVWTDRIEDPSENGD